MTSRVTRVALWFGVAVPLLYYGTQFAAMSFYPGYRISRQVASELGSNHSTMPAVFNGGAILTGAAALIAAVGFLRAVPDRVLAWLVFLAVLSNGAAGVWAGVHPLPDPRHSPGVIGAGMFVLPILFIIVAWRARSKPLLGYLIANLVVFLMLIPVMSGRTGIALDAWRGALQRVAALVMYVPIGVVAASLLQASTSRGGST